MSQPYIAMVESGERALDRKAAQAAIATALDISVAQLLGQPDESHTDPVLNRAAMLVTPLRSTLVEIAAGERRTPVRDLDGVRAAVRRLTELRNEANYADMMGLLPEVLFDLAGHGDVAAAEMVEALFGTRYALRSIGEADLAMTAAQIGLNVGRAQSSPAVEALAVYSYVQAFPPEQATLGVKLVNRAADGLQGYTDRESREMYGCLHVLAAFWAAIAQQGDAAHAHLDEAASVAEQLGEPVVYGPLSAGFNANWFGPTQVAIWRIAVAAELGDAAEAVAVSQRVNLAALPLPNRHVYYFLDLARALAAAGHSSTDVQALQNLARAERAAPQHVRANPVSRELAGTLIRRIQRRAVGADMIAMARRLGLNGI